MHTKRNYAGHIHLKTRLEHRILNTTIQIKIYMYMYMYMYIHDHCFSEFKLLKGEYTRKRQMVTSPSTHTHTHTPTHTHHSQLTPPPLVSPAAADIAAQSSSSTRAPESPCLVSAAASCRGGQCRHPSCSPPSPAACGWRQSCAGRSRWCPTLAGCSALCRCTWRLGRLTDNTDEYLCSTMYVCTEGECI